MCGKLFTFCLRESPTGNRLLQSSGACVLCGLALVAAASNLLEAASILLNGTANSVLQRVKETCDKSRAGSSNAVVSGTAGGFRLPFPFSPPFRLLHSFGLRTPASFSVWLT